MIFDDFQYIYLLISGIFSESQSKSHQMITWNDFKFISLFVLIFIEIFILCPLSCLISKDMLPQTNRFHHSIIYLMKWKLSQTKVKQMISNLIFLIINYMCNLPIYLFNLLSQSTFYLRNWRKSSKYLSY